MIFRETDLDGAFVVEDDRHDDHRGFFARTWCHDEFEARGLGFQPVQCNSSFNRFMGTLRGLHYQMTPHQEAKLVRCTRGRAFDVIVDLRPNSPTLHRWYGIELDAENGLTMYVPEGFAHGFQTLEDDTELFYQMSSIHYPESARAICWNDPTLAIDWPFAEPLVISAADRDAPPLHLT